MFENTCDSEKWVGKPDDPSLPLDTIVRPNCEHLKMWTRGMNRGTEPCGKPAKYIIHYDNGDKFACGIHANSYNKRAKNRGWNLAEELK